MPGDESQTRAESRSSDDGRPDQRRTVEDGTQSRAESQKRQPRGRQPGGGGGYSVDTDQLVYVVGLFAVVGGGIGLNALFASFVLSGVGGAVISGLLVTAGLGVSIFSGPVVAVVSSLRLDRRMDDEREAVLATGGAASAAGHLVSMVVAAVLLSVAVGGGSGGGGTGGSAVPVGDLIVPLVLIAVATGVAGAAAVYLQNWDRNRA
jgi:hypothetical protein